MGVEERSVEPAPLEPRLEPLGAVLRRGVRRAAAVLAVVAFLAAFGRRWPGWGFVAQALMGASGLVALAVLARPLSRQPLRACLRGLTLGFVAPAWGLATYAAASHLRAIGTTNDLAAGWAAARGTLRYLTLEWGASDLVMVVALATGANVATLLFSEERDCGPILLLPLPALLLLVGFGHAGSIPLALGATFGVGAFLAMLFHVVERARPRLLSGERRDEDD